MERVGAILRKSHPGRLVSKQRLRQSESVLMVRLKRESGNQELGYSSRPFVLCGLPVKRKRTPKLRRTLTFGLPKLSNFDQTRLPGKA